jgi:hypothetical protein
METIVSQSHGRRVALSRQRAGSAAARSAGRCIRMFDGRSEPRAAVARASLRVSHGNDLDFVEAEDVHKTERESGEYVSADTASLARPRLRATGHRVDGVPQLLAKAVANVRISIGVPCIRLFRLQPGSGVEPDGGRHESAAVQPRSKLFPGNGLHRT